MGFNGINIRSLGNLETRVELDKAATLNIARFDEPQP